MFDVPCGVSTYAETRCDFCNRVFNEGCGLDGSEDNLSSFSVDMDEFLNRNICSNCVKNLEGEIVRLMPNILPWYKKKLRVARSKINVGLEHVDDIEQINEW